MACGANLLLPLRQHPVRPFALVSPFCSFRDAPAPAAALGLCPFAASGEGRTRRREQPGPRHRCARSAPDSLGRGCAYRISILAVPLGINYAFRTRGYSNVKIVYLQLGELAAAAEREQLPAPRPPPPSLLAGMRLLGTDGTGSGCPVSASLSWGPCCSPAPPTSSRPVFPRSRCWSARLWS